MTTEAINLACAKLDGWTYPCKSCMEFGTKAWRNPTDDGCKLESQLPNYTASYDAVIPLIQKQNIGVMADIILATLKTHTLTFQANPLQLCEALLHATGQW